MVRSDHWAVLDATRCLKANRKTKFWYQHINIMVFGCNYWIILFLKQPESKILVIFSYKLWGNVKSVYVQFSILCSVKDVVTFRLRDHLYLDFFNVCKMSIILKLFLFMKCNQLLSIMWHVHDEEYSRKSVKLGRREKRETRSTHLSHRYL